MNRESLHTHTTHRPLFEGSLQKDHQQPKKSPLIHPQSEKLVHPPQPCRQGISCIVKS